MSLLILRRFERDIAYLPDQFLSGRGKEEGNQLFRVFRTGTAGDDTAVRQERITPVPNVFQVRGDPVHGQQFDGAVPEHFRGKYCHQ